MEARQYDELKRVQETHWWFKGKREIVTDFLDRYSKKGGNLLDVGCGMGLMLDVLDNYGDSYGMDMEPVAVEYCRSRLTPNQSFRIQQGYFPDNIPFEDNYFDTIIALDVLEHIEDDEGSMCKIRDLLTTDGVLIATVPALMSMWSYNDVLNHHYRRYEFEELKDKIIRSGFKIEKISFYNSKLFVIAYAVRKLKNALHIESSDVKENNGNMRDSFINKILYKIFVSEKNHLRKRDYKKGVSIILVARK